MNRIRMIQVRGFSPSCLMAAGWCFLFLASALPAAIAQDEVSRPNANGTANGSPDEAPLNVSVASWDRLTVQFDSEATRSVDGKIEIEALDGSLLFQDMLGHLLLLKSHEVLAREQHNEPVELTAAALESRLKEELPDGFRLHQTRHYTICYWTDREYAHWVGALYERLYAGFNNYWKNRGFDPQPAKRPLIVLVFANRAQFERFARTDMKAEPTGIIGYYHVLHNWVVMYDLTEDGQFGQRDRGLSQALSHPHAVPMVATIVHEATHQLMYNNGMQQRLADIPLWVSEGLAVYFEAPDITSKQGWKGIGKINLLRVQRAKHYLRQRPADSLATLMRDDKRFRDGNTTLDAYAEAWALNYFLLKKYAKQYQAYLQELSKKTPLVPQTGEERLALFEEKLGKSLAEIDREFVPFLQKLQ
jgi:hypothetical protein